ncbi:MAG: MFS transporter [Deltaproteobacteria bacterium]
MINDKSKSFLIFSVLSTLYCFSAFYHVSNAAIAADLVHELKLNVEDLGILGGAFFYSFALLQIPMGVLLDRIGPRLIIGIFSLVGALGAFIFALSHDFAYAIAGRVIMGIGMASVLMGSFKVFVNQFHEEKFSALSGLIVSIGVFGSLLATSPFAYLNTLLGWRNTFMCTAIITALLSLSVFWILKGTANKHVDGDFLRKNSAPHMNLTELMRFILGNLSFWQIGILGFFRYGTTVALQGLWLSPYLINVKGFDPIKTANVILMISLGMMLGYPLSGKLAKKYKATKKVALFGLSFYTLSLLPLTGFLRMNHEIDYAILCFFLGFFTGFGMLNYTHVKELFPLNVSGTVIAGINFFLMAGGAVFMQAIGKIVEYSQLHQLSLSQSYHLAFAFCFIGMAGSLIFYLFSKESVQSSG